MLCYAKTKNWKKEKNRIEENSDEEKNDDDTGDNYCTNRGGIYCQIL